MNIAFACHVCRQRYEVDAALAGRKVNCKKCGTTLAIPASNTPSPAAPDLARPPHPTQRPLQTFGAPEQTASPTHPPHAPAPPLQSSGAPDPAPAPSTRTTSSPPPPAAVALPPQTPLDDLYELEPETEPPLLPGKPAQPLDDFENPYAAPRAQVGAARGKRMPRATHIAGIWHRFCALFVDGLLQVIIILAFSFILGFALGAYHAITRTPMPEDELPLPFTLTIWSIIAAVYFLYEPIMLSAWGATIGKLALGLRVVDTSGQFPSFGRALGRTLCKFLLSGWFYIGYIMAFFDENKRALHDRIAGTYVVTTRA